MTPGWWARIEIRGRSLRTAAATTRITLDPNACSMMDPRRLGARAVPPPGAGRNGRWDGAHPASKSTVSGTARGSLALAMPDDRIALRTRRGRPVQATDIGSDSRASGPPTRPRGRRSSPAGSSGHRACSRRRARDAALPHLVVRPRRGGSGAGGRGGGLPRHPERQGHRGQSCGHLDHDRGAGAGGHLPADRGPGPGRRRARPTCPRGQDRELSRRPAVGRPQPGRHRVRGAGGGGHHPAPGRVPVPGSRPGRRPPVGPRSPTPASSPSSPTRCSSTPAGSIRCIALLAVSPLIDENLYSGDNGSAIIQQPGRVAPYSTFVNTASLWAFDPSDTTPPAPDLPVLGGAARRARWPARGPASTSRSPPPPT